MSNIRLSYDLFSILSKCPRAMLLELYDLLQECADPAYHRALACVVSGYDTRYTTNTLSGDSTNCLCRISDPERVEFRVKIFIR